MRNLVIFCLVLTIFAQHCRIYECDPIASQTGDEETTCGHIDESGEHYDLDACPSDMTCSTINSKEASWVENPATCFKNPGPHLKGDLAPGDRC